MNRRRLTISLLTVCLIYMTAPTRADEVSEGNALLRPDAGSVGAVAATYQPAERDPSAVSAFTDNVAGVATASAPVAAQAPPSIPEPVGIPALCNIPQGPGGNCVSFVDPPEPEKPNKGRPPQQPSPQEVARRLLDRAVARAPEPQLSVAPARIGLTGLPSYFWLSNDLPPITATARVPGLTVTAEARPVEYVWDFGDGSQKVTTHPGRPWSKRRPGNISYLYETKARYELSVEVVWGARWRINGGPWQPLGYFSTSASRAYPVREIIAVLVQPHPRF